MCVSRETLRLKFLCQLVVIEGRITPSSRADLRALLLECQPEGQHLVVVALLMAIHTLSYDCTVL